LLWLQQAFETFVPFKYLHQALDFIRATRLQNSFNTGQVIDINQLRNNTASYASFLLLVMKNLIDGWTHYMTSL